MNEMEIRRTPEVVGAEIRSLTTQAKCITLWYGIEIGRRLCEAKELVEHGEWLNFLERETEFSQPSASRFMRLYNEYGADQGSLFGAESKYSTLNNLSISNALRLLELPENEREDFAKANDAEHISTRELERLIREKKEAEEQLQAADEGHALAMAELQELLDAAEERARTAEREATQAKNRAAEAAAPFEERIRELEQENKKLSERPVEVAVQVDEKAVQEAAAVARAKEAAEWSGKFAELKNQDADKERRISGLEKQLEEAKTKLIAAEERAVEDAGPYKEEVERLKKQLALSNAEVAVFNIHFAAVQDSFNKLLASLDKVKQTDAETAGKLEKALRAVLGQFEGRIDAG